MPNAPFISSAINNGILVLVRKLHEYVFKLQQYILNRGMGPKSVHGGKVVVFYGRCETVMNRVLEKFAHA